MWSRAYREVREGIIDQLPAIRCAGAQDVSSTVATAAVI